LDRTPSTKTKRYNTGDFDKEKLDKPLLYNKIRRTYKRYGISVAQFDGYIDSIPGPDLIFVGSGMTYWIEGLNQTIRRVRARFPNTPVCIGGTAASLIPGYISAMNTNNTFIFPRRLTDNTGRLGLPCGLHLERSGWIPGLLDAFALIRPERHGAVLTSLGCPCSCSYCASHMLQGGFHFRQPEDIIKESLFLIDTLDSKNIAFYDDALLFESSRHFVPLMESLRRKDVFFHTPNGLHLKWITAKTAACMKQSNFKTLRFGYESGRQKFRKDTSRKASLELIEQKTAVLYNAGFSGNDIGIYVMAGLPGQRPADVYQEIRAVARFGTKVKPVFLSPVPGTPLFYHYEKQFPAIKSDPLWHNDVFFITQLDGWSENAVEEIKTMSREIRAS
ncbi:MAG: radical SAM protein, partial [Chitinivibrionales bacterium]|nr:radical SAM protein [Chitinivibrionales bacterium]